MVKLIQPINYRTSIVSTNPIVHRHPIIMSYGRVDERWANERMNLLIKIIIFVF